MKKNSNQNSEQENQESFRDRIKNDSKYKAKVELSGYLIVIVIIIVFLNISNIGKNYDYNSTANNTTKKSETTEENQLNLLKQLLDNYNYTVQVAIKETDENNNVKDINYSYSGKSYDDSLEIIKQKDNIQATYYKVEDEYYVPRATDQTTYDLAKVSDIYDEIDAKYIELTGVKKYLKLSSLDHVTEYSAGKKEYVYDLKVKDILKNYQEDEVVTIHISVENATITMKIDYTNLMRKVTPKISDCVITYSYSNINKVEEFNIFLDEEKTNQSGEKNTAQSNS